MSCEGFLCWKKVISLRSCDDVSFELIVENGTFVACPYVVQAVRL